MSSSTATMPWASDIVASTERDKIIRAIRLEQTTHIAAADDSALDTDAIHLPSPSFDGRTRRRSELLRADDLAVNIELSALPSYLSERPTRRLSFVHNVAAVTSTQTIVGVAEAKDAEAPAAAKHVSFGAAVSYIDEAHAEISRAQQAAYKRNGRLHFLTICYCLFLEGWNDGTTGTLLPAIQNFYHVGFAVVSLLFVVNCIGFITGAFLGVWLNDKYGFGKVMVLGSIFQISTYAIQAPAPPFAVMVFANSLAGFGMALQNAQANGFIGSLKEHKSTKLGFIHASYGLGAFAAPLVATQFSVIRHWSFHYLISTGLAAVNILCLILVFRFKQQDELMEEAGQEISEVQPVREGLYRQIMGLKAVHFLALFALIYIGVEVTVGGWIVTFIIRERQGGANSGYISSGFFGGLTLGRVSLMWLNKWIGEQRVIFVYSLLAIGFEITIWVVPSMIENAVAVSFIGLLLGPMFPIAVGHASRVLPPRLLTGCVGWITGIGMSGSAALPFMTGVLASKYGIGSLQPLLVAMMVTMVGVWALVPKGQRRSD